MARSTRFPYEQPVCWLKAFSDESVDATEVVSTQPKSSHSSRTVVQVHSHTAAVSRKVFQPQGDELGDESTPATSIETNGFQIATNAQQSDDCQHLVVNHSDADS